MPRPAYLRPALALAAAVAVVALVALWPRGDRSPQLRGTPGAASPAIESVRLDESGLHLNWSAYPGADAYRAILVDDQGRETARIALEPGTAATVAPDRLPFVAGDAARAFVRIAALREGEVLATSPARPVLGP